MAPLPRRTFHPPRPVIQCACRFACKVFFFFVLLLTALRCSFTLTISPPELLRLLSAVCFLLHTLPPLNSPLSRVFSTRLPWIPHWRLHWRFQWMLKWCLMKVDFSTIIIQYVIISLCFFDLSKYIEARGSMNLCSLHFIHISTWVLQKHPESEHTFFFCSHTEDGRWPDDHGSPTLNYFDSLTWI